VTPQTPFCFSLIESGEIVRLTMLGLWSRFRGMAKTAKKKSVPKKAAKKPAAVKSAAKKPTAAKSVVKKPAAAKSAAKPAAKAAVPAREQAATTPYTPKPIEGVGWPAFRYPLS
jgi:hypothetical protein